MPDAPTTKPMYQARPAGVRRLKDGMFEKLCMGVATLAVLLLVTLLVSIAWRGLGRLSGDFLTGVNSSTSPESAGIGPALLGSIVLLIICAATAIPIGVGTAILLEEYAPKHPLLRKLHGFVQTNITNLAGVPSIVYGILGVTAFASMFGLFGPMNDPDITIGQRGVFQFYDIAGNPYYTEGPAQTPDVDAAVPVAEPGMTLFANADLSEQADVRILPAEELEPIKDRITQDLGGIESAIRNGLRDTQETRRGPVIVGEAAAQSIADTAFATTALNADTDELKRITVEALIGMDGLQSRELRKARFELKSQLEEAELKASGVSGLIITGSVPQWRAIRKPWYVQFPLGRSVLAGGLTLMLVILPIIIVASQEAIRAVPPSMRAGSLALGGTKWQAIQKVVLPAAIPGICTGSILAMSRAIGEAAPIILLGAVFISFAPVFRDGGSFMDGFSAMPLQIYQWTGEPDEAFRDTAAAGIIVLLTVLLSFNAVAVFIRQKTSAKN